MTEDSAITGLSRRRFMVRTALAASTAVLAPSFALPELGFAEQPPTEMPPLPWPEDALEPIISARTISFHYGKHHRTYFDTMVKLLDATELKGQSFEEILKATAINIASGVMTGALEAGVIFSRMSTNP